MRLCCVQCLLVDFFFCVCVSGMHMVGESQSNNTSPPIPLCKWKNVPYGRPSQKVSHLKDPPNIIDPPPI